MGLREKIANAEPTNWLTENMTEEEILETVIQAKEKAREQLERISNSIDDVVN